MVKRSLVLIQKKYLKNKSILFELRFAYKYK